MFQATTLAVLVTTYSLVGLVAVWGALGRGHWFGRVAAVLLFLSAWLAAPDYGIWVAFLVQSMIVIAALLFVRSLRTPAERALEDESGPAARPRARPKFTLSDLLLLTLVAGVVISILAWARPDMQGQWLSSVVPGVVYAIITLTAVWATGARRKLWVRLATLVVLFPTCLIGGWLWLARAARSRFGRIVAATSLLLMAAPPAAFYWWLVAPRFLSLPAPLKDNGIDDLLRAAKMVNRPAVDVNALSDDALAAYLIQHREALERARAGLARPCQRRLPADASYWQGNSLDEPQMLRQLARVLAAAGRLQLLKGNHREAAVRYFEAVRLGEAMMHGGTMLDAQLGTASQMTGLEELRKILPQLDSAACRELAARLAELDERQETFDQIAAREVIYYKKYRPWGERWILSQVPEMFEESRRVSAASFNRGLAILRLFRCHLALREYWLARAAYPDTLAKLSPPFLAELPSDPFSGGAFVYRRLPVGYQLHSVGSDGIDDGGRPLSPGVSPDKAKGDVVLDVSLPP
ncbi:MAG TPA: hypothetical protein VMV10_01970 [Pirellulales bacterium]|nr:hypothetical protein [Pirellulales bacterium]